MAAVGKIHRTCKNTPQKKNQTKHVKPIITTGRG